MLLLAFDCNPDKNLSENILFLALPWCLDNKVGVKIKVFSHLIIHWVRYEATRARAHWLVLTLDTSGSHVAHHAGAPDNISADNKWLWWGGESEAGAKIVRNILCTLENKGSEGGGWDERSMSSFQFQKWFRQLLWQRNGVHQSVLQRIKAGDFNFMITWSGQWQGWADLELKKKV